MYNLYYYINTVLIQFLYPYHMEYKMERIKTKFKWFFLNQIF